MSLINLKTDLKSLKYGQDRKGGGSSNQPYIATPIPEGSTSSSPDFLLRNGYLNPISSVNDVSRLTQMFFDLKSPNGLLFTAKQNLLSRTAVQTQTSTGPLNNGVYNPLSTISQAGVISTGYHLNKQGTNPFDLTGAYSNNDALYGVKIKYNQPTDENRLAGLYNNYITVRNESTNVLSYSGGPGSNLGIGQTNIRFASPEQRTGTNNPLSLTNPTYFYDGYQRSIDEINNQVGGLQIDSEKSWIKSPLYDLPSFNVNSPQSGSLSLIKSDSTTWTAEQNITGPNGSNYNLFNSSGSSNFYQKYSGQSPNNTEFNNFTPSIYKSGSLTGDTSQLTLKKGSQKQNITGPNGPNYNWFKSNGSSKIYLDLTKTTIPGLTSYWNTNEGKPLWQNNVYTQGNTFPENKKNENSKNSSIYANNTFVYTQQNIISTPNNEGKLNGSPKIQDFRAILRNKLQSPDKEKATNLGATPISPDYNDKNIEKRVNLGDPGQRANKNYSSYTKGVTLNGEKVGPLDKINAKPIYKSTSVIKKPDVNDLVKFRIAVIDNNNPNIKNFIHFRAFIDSFSDSYNGEWASHKFLGRAEDFYTYSGFKRTLSLSWTVAAQSKEELIPMYKKLNYLASLLAPDYSRNGFMKGNLIQLTVGGYLYEQVGWFGGINYELVNDASWEIGIDDSGNSDSTVKELPHMIKVTGFTFTPIHNFVPSKQILTFDNTGITGYGSERFIALSNGINNNYDN
jgi:hypothetical protein